MFSNWPGDVIPQISEPAILPDVKIMIIIFAKSISHHLPNLAIQMILGTGESQEKIVGQVREEQSLSRNCLEQMSTKALTSTLPTSLSGLPTTFRVTSHSVVMFHTCLRVSFDPA